MEEAEAEPQQRQVRRRVAPAEREALQPIEHASHGKVRLRQGSELNACPGCVVLCCQEVSPTALHVSCTSAAGPWRIVHVW